MMRPIQWPSQPIAPKQLEEWIGTFIGPLTEEEQRLLLEFLLARHGLTSPPGNDRLLVRVLIAEASEVEVVEVPPNCFVHDLTCELSEQLNLQTIVACGQKISYGMIAHRPLGKSQVLDPFATLEKLGVRSGSDLILFPQVDA